MSKLRLFQPGARGLDLRLTIIFGLIALAVGIWSVPASLWEWDEILFARSLHTYDIVLHSPHPPGFPLYVFAARGALLLGADDKTALCLVGLIFAFILGASAYAAFREIFEDRRTAAAGASLLLFVPPVMLYAGAPRSDLPGMAAGLLVIALALKGRTSPKALAAAGLALGLGCGVRVTILAAAAPVLIGVSLIYLKRRRWKPVLIAAALSVLSVTACYLPVVLVTGFGRYRGALEAHGRYTSSTDTIFAPNMNGNVSYRMGRFFLDIWGEPSAAKFVYLLAAIGLIVLIVRRRGRTIGWLALAFLPVLAFTVLYMTPLAAPLYALPFLPLFVALAAAALVPPGRPDVSSGRRLRFRPVGWALAAAILVTSAVWTAPVLNMRRSQNSPSWETVTQVLKTKDPQKTDLFYTGIFLPFVRYAFGAYHSIPFEKAVPRAFNLLDPEASLNPGFALSTAPIPGTNRRHFTWMDPQAKEKLGRLSLGRYLDAYLLDEDTQRKIVPAEGWSLEDFDADRSWRWMGRRSETSLLALHEKMTLKIKAAVSVRALKPGEKATIVLKLDGREIDRVETAGGIFERTVTVATPPPSPWKTLTIENDRVIAPAGAESSNHAPEEGLQVFELEWNPAPGAERIIYGLQSFVGEGWYASERDRRWTRGEAYLKLPAIRTAGQLDLQLEVSEGPDRRRGRVTLEMDGRVIDAFDPPLGIFSRVVTISPEMHGGREVLLRISTDQTFLAPFGRHLGVCVYYASWSPVEINP